MGDSHSPTEKVFRQPVGKDLKGKLKESKHEGTISVSFRKEGVRCK